MICGACELGTVHKAHRPWIAIETARIVVSKEAGLQDGRKHGKMDTSIGPNTNLSMNTSSRALSLVGDKVTRSFFHISKFSVGLHEGSCLSAGRFIAQPILETLEVMSGWLVQAKKLLSLKEQRL